MRSCQDEGQQSVAKNCSSPKWLRPKPQCKANPNRASQASLGFGPGSEPMFPCTKLDQRLSRRKKRSAHCFTTLASSGIRRNTVKTRHLGVSHLARPPRFFESLVRARLEPGTPGISLPQCCWSASPINQVSKRKVFPNSWPSHKQKLMTISAEYSHCYPKMKRMLYSDSNSTFWHLSVPCEMY